MNIGFLWSFPIPGGKGHAVHCTEEKALHLLQSSRAKLDSPALYNAAAGACERGLQVDILLEIFRVMMETHLEAVSWSLLGFPVLHARVGRFSAREPKRQDAITYLALISTCGKTQRWNEALLHFQSALHSSIAMSQSLMNSATQKNIRHFS